MNHTVVVSLIVFLAVSAAAPGADSAYLPTDAERARWTLQDMRSWKIALEAYRQDNGAYPAGATLQQAAAAIEGKYISKVPMHDAWGQPYLYASTGGGFTLVSAGADGRFERRTWTTAEQLDSLDADAVINEQAKFWLRSWKFR